MNLSGEIKYDKVKNLKQENTMKNVSWITSEKKGFRRETKERHNTLCQSVSEDKEADWPRVETRVNWYNKSKMRSGRPEPAEHPISLMRTRRAICELSIVI